MSVIDTLVTDRSPADFYGAEDLNRVGEAIEYVAKQIERLGVFVTIEKGKVWADNSNVFKEDILSILKNLRTIQSSIVLAWPAISVPSGAQPFDAKEANNIEKILQNVDLSVRGTVQAWPLCGEFFAGEV